MQRNNLPHNVLEAKREVRHYLRFLEAESKRRSHRLDSESRFHRRNVTAIGIGPKVVCGVPQEALAIRVYVKRKLPKRLLGRCVLPTQLDGVATDVVVCGPFRAFGEGAAAARALNRPIAPGISIGFSHSSRVIAGTLGALVSC